MSEHSTPLGWYKWYPRDFYSSVTVRSMSFVGRSIYRELLDLQWENGNTCSTSVERLLNTLGVTFEQWQQFEPYYEELFPNGINKRLATLREEAITERQKKVLAGLKSGESRKNRPPKKNTRLTRVQHVLNKTETETLFINPIILTEEVEFIDRIHKEYPKRKGDLGWKKADQKLKALPPSERQDVINGVIGYRQFCESTGKVGTEYVKQAITFLNGQTWKEYQPKQEKPRGWFPDTDWVEDEPGLWRNMNTGETREYAFES